MIVHDQRRNRPAGMLETNRRKIVARLLREGWADRGGADHDVFIHPGKGRVILPRHREISVGVARDIGRKAGWE